MAVGKARPSKGCALLCMWKIYRHKRQFEVEQTQLHPLVLTLRHITMDILKNLRTSSDYETLAGRLALWIRYLGVRVVHI